MSDPPFSIDWAGIEAGVKATAALRARERARRGALRTAEYRPALVTFLDILGFRNLVASRPAGEIGRILADLQALHNSEYEEGVPEPGDAGVIAFSDSIVRVVPVDGEDQTGALFHELFELALAQAELAVKGVFLRGGIAYGNIVFDGKTVFGPALVRAYDIESRTAVSPRIILDPALLQTYASTPALWGEDHDFAEDLEWVSGYLHNCEDGQITVDYLRAIERNLDEGVTYESVISRHRDRVIAARARAPDDRVRAKYAWVADYHNRVIDSRPDPTEFAAFRILQAEP